MANLVMDHMSASGINVMSGFVPTQVSKTEAALDVRMATVEGFASKTESFDTVLIATGMLLTFVPLGKNLWVVGHWFISTDRIIAKIEEFVYSVIRSIETLI